MVWDLSRARRKATSPKPAFLTLIHLVWRPVAPSPAFIGCYFRALGITWILYVETGQQPFFTLTIRIFLTLNPNLLVSM